MRVPPSLVQSHDSIFLLKWEGHPAPGSPGTQWSGTNNGDTALAVVWGLCFAPSGRSSTSRSPTETQYRSYRVRTHCLSRGRRPVSDAHMPTLPGALHRGSACCLDAGGGGIISSKLDWLEPSVFRPLGTQGWVRWECFARPGLQMDTMSDWHWLSRVALANHGLVLSHTGSVPSRVISRFFSLSSRSNSLFSCTDTVGGLVLCGTSDL